VTRVRTPGATLATDRDAVRTLLAEHLQERIGFQPEGCELRVLKRTERRLVVRYRLAGEDSQLDVVGKWYGTDRGQTVAHSLSSLRERGFGEAPFAVPEVYAYLPEYRVVLTEAVDGPILRERLYEDPAAASRAGAWLARFHRTDLTATRSCGPDKQRGAVARWAEEVPELRTVATELDAALADLADPELPVHYDYYHSQIVLSGEATVVLDLDEAGMGDPAFDVAHFEAHLRLLALQWLGRPDGFDPAIERFRSGYRSAGGRVERRPPLEAFAWFKLAHQAYRRDAAAEERDYALDAVRGSLSAA